MPPMWIRDRVCSPGCCLAFGWLADMTMACKATVNIRVQISVHHFLFSVPHGRCPSNLLCVCVCVYGCTCGDQRANVGAVPQDTIYHAFFKSLFIFIKCFACMDVCTTGIPGAHGDQKGTLGARDCRHRSYSREALCGC